MSFFLQVQTKAFLFLVGLLWVGSALPAQTYPSEQTLATGPWSRQFVVGDLNGDGRADIFYLSNPPASATSSQPQSAGVYLQGLAGVFTPAAVTWSAPAGSYWPILGDFRGVGLPDAMIASFTRSYVVGAGPFRLHLDHLLNDGSGALAGGPPALDVPAMGANLPEIAAMATADLNRDGKLDLLITDAGNRCLYVLLNNGDGTFREASVIPFANGAAELLTGDFDGDGIPDVLVLNPLSGTVVLLHGNGDGSLQQSAVFSVPSPLPDLGGMLYADVDGDGLPDLVVSQFYAAPVVFPGTPNGLRQGTPQVLTLNGANAMGLVLAVADLNGDGKPDLLWSALGLFGPQGLSVLNGDGGWAFHQGSFIEAGQDAFDPSVVADFNNDHVLDVAYAVAGGVEIHFGSLPTPVTPSGAVTASPEPSLYGGAVSLTLTLQTASGSVAPSGTVTFSVDGVSVGTATVSNGTATLALNPYSGAIGSHTISAAYAGDVTYAAATFAGTHVVQGLPSVTTVTNLVTPIFYGQEIGYTNGVDAQVTASPAPGVVPPAGATTAGGEVYVYIDGVLLCELLEGGTGPGGGPERCSDAAFMGFAAGQHIMMAAYQGNSYFAPSTSATYIVTILPDATQTVLATSVSPTTVGSAVTFTATVSAPYATPTGLVTFLDGTAVLGQGALNASGVATLTTSGLTMGTHTITGQYGATQNFNASASAAVQQVVLNASSVLLLSSLNPSTVGQAVTFTATVFVGAGASSTPGTGTVIFTDGTTVLGSAALSAQGTLSLTTASLSVGPHQITATFVGNGVTAGSASAPLQQVVLAPVPAGFTLLVTPGHFAVGVGDSTSVSVTVTPLGSFSQPVSLSCAGLPNESTCTFAEAVVPPGGGTTQLTVHAEAPHSCGSTQQYFVAGPGTQWWLGGVGAGALLLLRVWRRRWGRSLLLLATLCVGSMLGGCGTGNCTDLATRPGTYTFTVTGTASGSVNQTQSQTVTIVAHL